MMRLAQFHSLISPSSQTLLPEVFFIICEFRGQLLLLKLFCQLLFHSDLCFIWVHILNIFLCEMERESWEAKYSFPKAMPTLEK